MLLAHGAEKYRDGSSGLLATRVWDNIVAERRQHMAGEIRAFVPSANEIALILRGASTTVTRESACLVQCVTTSPAAIWLCPAGVVENALVLSGEEVEVLHLYLPAELGCLAGLDASTDRYRLKYSAGLHDDLISAIAMAVLQELSEPSFAGKLLVETLAVALEARLIAHHSEKEFRYGGCRPEAASPIEPTRLGRVLEYVEANLAENFGLDELANIACLSKFHFARAFKAAIGCPPHTYVRQRRVELAKRLLLHSPCQLGEIAGSCNFSSQANFTRAFKQATGHTPAEFRSLRGGRDLLQA